MAVDNLCWLLPDVSEVKAGIVQRAFVDQGLSDLFPNYKFTESSRQYEHDFRLLRKLTPCLFKDSLQSYTRSYNLKLSEFINTFPSTAGAVWAVYRAVQRTPRKEDLCSDLACEGDTNFALNYLLRNVSSDRLFLFGEDIESSRSDFLSGIPLFKFRDRTGKEVETIWDLDQEKLPEFALAK